MCLCCHPRACGRAHDKAMEDSAAASSRKTRPTPERNALPTAAEMSSNCCAPGSLLPRQPKLRRPASSACLISTLISATANGQAHRSEPRPEILNADAPLRSSPYHADRLVHMGRSLTPSGPHPRASSCRTRSRVGTLAEAAPAARHRRRFPRGDRAEPGRPAGALQPDDAEALP